MLSPAKAAEIAGVSRSLVSRAIRDAELIATRRNNGQWSIDRADLDDWMSRRTERASAPDTPPPPAPARDPADIERIDAMTAEIGDLRERLGRLEGEATATAVRIDDLIEARDAARADLTDARSKIDGLAGERDQARADLADARKKTARTAAELSEVRARGLISRILNR